MVVLRVVCFDGGFESGIYGFYFIQSGFQSGFDGD